MARVSAACHCTVSINSRLRYCMDVLWKKPQLPQVQISFTHLIWLHFTQPCLPLSSSFSSSSRRVELLFHITLQSHVSPSLPPSLPPPEELSCFFISLYTHTCNSLWLHKLDWILIFFMGCMHRLFKASKSWFFSRNFITLKPVWSASQWRVQDFPDEESANLKGVRQSIIFAKNCMKMKEIGPRRGHLSLWHPPWVCYWLRYCQKPLSRASHKLASLSKVWPWMDGIPCPQVKLVILKIRYYRSLKWECLQNPEMEVKFLVFIQRISHWSTLSVPIAIDY